MSCLDLLPSTNQEGIVLSRVLRQHCVEATYRFGNGHILMEKGRARRFQPTTPAPEQCWNVVEFTTRIQIRQKIHELLRLCGANTVTTSEIRKEVLQSVAAFGNEFATQLVRSLHREDDAERQSLIWLLTLLNDPETIHPLQTMASSQHLPRATRLAASLVLAGMGVTAQTIEQNRRVHLYALT